MNAATAPIRKSDLHKRLQRPFSSVDSRFTGLPEQNRDRFSLSALSKGFGLSETASPKIWVGIADSFSAIGRFQNTVLL